MEVFSWSELAEVVAKRGIRYEVEPLLNGAWRWGDGLGGGKTLRVGIFTQGGLGRVVSGALMQTLVSDDGNCVHVEIALSNRSCWSCWSTHVPVHQLVWTLLDDDLPHENYAKVKLKKVIPEVCPACGDVGEWRMMALVCRRGHGVFQG